jgi:U3 small nucleolar RNA-associated protein 3
LVFHKLLIEISSFRLKDVGATDKGLEYILTKSLLQTSTTLNVAAYVLLKSEQAKKSTDMNDLKLSDDAGSEIKSHPVMARLQQLNRLQQKLEDEVEKKLPSIGEQIENLVKAAALMNEEPEESDDEEQHSQADKGGDLDSEQIHDEEPSKEKVAFSADDDAEERGHNHVDEEEMARAVLLEARFGLRPQELNSDSHTRDKQRRPAPSDFGDEEANESHSRKAYQALASTINSIQQRSVTKSHKSKRLDEDLDSQDNDELKLGLEIMEQDIGPMDEDDDDVEGDDEIDEELADGLGGNSYYDRVAKKSHMKREFKKDLYKVAPKYPGMEAEIDGERAISKAILKNRGLVAHKAKINRNPRVKKREQYRKALIRRKGKVREVRTLEGHKYGGEGTGIKTGISRSRKL